MKRVSIFAIMFLFVLVNTVFAEEGQPVKTSDQIVIVNKAVNKLAVYEAGKLVHEFSVATGASAISTPEGKFKVIVKWECPVYYKTNSGGCTDGNPLGPRWLGLDVPGTAGYTYGIHGNASPWSIGSYASAGCVRMHNGEVTQLFELIKMNTPVIIIRSGDSFDEIAQKNGYKVVKATPSNERITLMGKTPTYYGMHKELSTKENLGSQEVTVIAKMDDWFRIKTAEQTYWVNTKNYVQGKVYNEEVFVFAGDGDVLYENPNDLSPKKESKKVRVLKSKQHTDNWYYVEVDKEEFAWVKSDQVDKVTATEWDFQEKTPSITNFLLNELKSEQTENSMIWLLVAGLRT